MYREVIQRLLNDFVIRHRSRTIYLCYDLARQVIDACPEWDPTHAIERLMVEIARDPRVEFKIKYDDWYLVRLTHVPSTLMVKSGRVSIEKAREILQYEDPVEVPRHWIDLVQCSKFEDHCLYGADNEHHIDPEILRQAEEPEEWAYPGRSRGLSIFFQEHTRWV